MSKNAYITSNHLPGIANAIKEYVKMENDKLVGVIPTTYEELVNLRNTSSLRPGFSYRITDYVTTTTQTDTISANHQFDIIVTADSENTLNEVARATQHEGDTYFTSSDLNAWEIWYCLDNDTNRFAWANASEEDVVLDLSTTPQLAINTSSFSSNTITGTGQTFTLNKPISHIIWNGNTYDLSQLQTSTGAQFSQDTPVCVRANSSTSLRVFLNVFSDSISASFLDTYPIEVYTSEYTTRYAGKGVIYRMIDERSNECPYDFKNIMFKHPKDKYTYPAYYYTFTTFSSGIVSDHSLNNSHCYNNVIKKYITLISGNRGISLNNIVFINKYPASNCYSNTFGNDCDYNSFGNGCTDNSFGNGCSSNFFGNGFSSNYAEDSFTGNSFGNDCNYNTFGSGCYINEFGNNCQHNTFGNNCQHNTFGSGCQHNKFGNNCQHNTFGNNCDYNTFGNDCYENSFVNNCQYNSFEDNCHNNTFGNDCGNNSFGNNCYSNSFMDSCDNNLFGKYCDSNSFGNECNNNSFGNECYSNSFMDSCDNNSFGYRCQNNYFGNELYSNSFGNNCISNSFRTTADEVGDLLDYCQYNTFDNGCKQIVIYSTSTINVNYKLQNIKVDKSASTNNANYVYYNVTTLNSTSPIFISKEYNTAPLTSSIPIGLYNTSTAINNKVYTTNVTVSPIKSCINAAGGFYETSDERLKNFSDDVTIDLEKLSSLKKKYFTWKDGHGDQQLGVSAQEVQVLYPELVNEGDDGNLSVDYAKLSVVALSAVDKLYNKQKDLEDKLAKIEKALNL